MVWLIIFLLAVLALVVTGFWGRFVRGRKNDGKGISLLVPFRADNDRRNWTWNWLREYWKNELPDAELVMGHNERVPFSKTEAVNDARRRARGDIIVILDADCYLPGSVVLECAERIRASRKRGNKLWFIPYRHFYRLTDYASERILRSSPMFPFRYADPPPDGTVEPDYTGSSVGHWFGALIQIMPKEAFDLVGGMDTRFSGWGGEDVSFMVALDTLYAPHKTTRNGVIHLWHPKLGHDWDTRRWAGQDTAGTNSPLANRYQAARGRVARMRALVDENK